ncbi:MAG: DUF1844 domain-containing protein [Verrucomicrobiota bacterium]
MNDSHASERNTADGEQAALMSARFAQMVMQQSELAMMLLGGMEHPEGGKVAKDIEGAKLFIDQLEMLEVKTKGNLSKEESSLLKQTLMALRLAFVESVNAGPAAGAAPAAESKPAEPAPGAPAGEEESRRKFSKKY